MKALAVVIVLFGCAEGVGISDKVEMEQLCDYVFSPDSSAHDITQTAAERWSAATGLNVCIGEQGIPVSWVDEILTSDGRQARGATKIVDCQAVSVRIASYAQLPSAIATHEVGHVLSGKCNNEEGHSESGVMHSPVVYDVIDQTSLGLVCSTANCLQFSPELSVSYAVRN